MTAARRLFARIASALTGVAIGVLLVTLVVASFVITPRSATRARPDVAAAGERAAVIARGGARLRAEPEPEAVVVAALATAEVVAAASVPTAAPTTAPTPEPTPEPTPAPTPAPTAPPTPRPAPLVAVAPLITTSTQQAEQRMLTLMNASRAAGGLVALSFDAVVSETARAHSEAESQVQYVYHDGPDGTARSRDGAACASGWYGENTGKVWQGNVDRLHVEFMSEPWAPINHRTNIMDPLFRRVGIGAVQGPDALYMTMVFCR